MSHPTGFASLAPAPRELAAAHAGGGCNPRKGVLSKSRTGPGSPARRLWIEATYSLVIRRRRYHRETASRPLPPGDRIAAVSMIAKDLVRLGRVPKLGEFPACRMTLC